MKENKQQQSVTTTVTTFNRFIYQVLLLPDVIWLYLFVPTFLYYISTRILHQSGLFGKELGIPIVVVNNHMIPYHNHVDFYNNKNQTIVQCWSFDSSTKNTTTKKDCCCCCESMNEIFHVLSSSIQECRQKCKKQQQQYNNNNNNQKKDENQEKNHQFLPSSSSVSVLKYGLMNVHSYSSSTNSHEYVHVDKSDQDSNNNQQCDDHMGEMNESTTCTASTKTSKNPSSSTTTTTTTTQSGIVDLQWIYDSELGRGYLLYSTMNQIYRWERGGGPIPIGRTLHLDYAGCRSNLYEICCSIHNSTTTTTSDNMIPYDRNMVGGMTYQKVLQKSHSYKKVDTTTASTSSTTILIIAEWGEKRIIRLESETGVRTPLMITIPSPPPPPPIVVDDDDDDDHSSNSKSKKEGIRLSHNPNRIVHTPYDDLFAIINHHVPTTTTTTTTNEQQQQQQSTIPYIIKLGNVSKIPPLPSLRMSRAAHEWEHMNVGNRNQSFVAGSESSLLPTIWFYDPTIQSITSIVFQPPPVLASSKRDTKTKLADLVHQLENDDPVASLLVTVHYTNGTNAILEIPYYNDPEELEQDQQQQQQTDHNNNSNKNDDNAATTKQNPIRPRHTKIRYDISSILSSSISNSSLDNVSGWDHYRIKDMVVSQSGTIFVALNYDDHVDHIDSIQMNEGNVGVGHQYYYSMILIIQSNGSISTFPVHDSVVGINNNNNNEQLQQQQPPLHTTTTTTIITSIELGTDGYLYLATKTTTTTTTRNNNHFGNRRQEEQQQDLQQQRQTTTTTITNSILRIRTKEKPIQ